MRIVVIGGSGHIGTYLIPRLIRAGHDVVNISRQGATGYRDDEEWQDVHQMRVDRAEEDRAGTFARTVVSQRPDAVIDLICFTEESASALLDGVRGHTGHLIHCGSIWREGVSRKLPIREDDAGAAEAPLDDYGIQKRRIAALMKAETADGGVVTTTLHPGHIVGPGWEPIGPLGNRDPAVWYALSAGRTIRIPGIGTEMLHHVHADDVAQAFELAVARRDAAAGEDFSIVAPSALSVRGFLHHAAAWFGLDARIESVDWDGFRAATTPEAAETSWRHLSRSHVFSIDKARMRLGYTPRYEPEHAIREAVEWLVARGELEVARPLVR
jgi:nucleoside-diphosphate-sugar epimerase